MKEQTRVYSSFCISPLNAASKTYGVIYSGFNSDVGGVFFSVLIAGNV